MSDEYTPFGGIAGALRSFAAFPMDPRMRAMMYAAAKEIERLQGELAEAKRDINYPRWVAPETSPTSPTAAGPAKP